jgi:hypothetical protein
MKRKEIFIIIGSVSLLILGIFTFSCSKTSDSCTKCDTPEPENHMVSFDFNGDEITTEISIYEGINHMGENFSFADKIIKSSELQYFSNFISDYTGSNIVPFKIILYLGKDIQNNNIKAIDILGFSYYIIIDKKLYHNLFIKDGDTFHKESKLQAETDELYADHLHFIIFNVIPETNEKSILVLHNSEYQHIDLLNPKNILDNKISNYITNSGSGGSPKVPNDCTSPCSPPQANLRCVFWEQALQWMCVVGQAPICVAEEGFIVVSDSTSISSDSIEEAYDLEMFISFRNNFMKDNDIGQKYIDYYYDISAEISGNMNLDLALDIFNILINYNERLDWLQNTQSFGDEILIDNDLYYDLIDLLDEFDLISDDQDFEDIIEAIKSDIATYKGYTIEEIISAIE